MDFIWRLLFFSWAGFLLEITYARLVTRARGGRKCLLFLPLCPVYGTSIALLLALPRFMLDNPFFLFFGGALLCTGVEYLFALFYERVWGVRFWDYSALPFHCKGRVCLSFAFLWGILIALLLPPLAGPIDALGRSLPPGLIAGGFAAFLADWCCTGLVLRRGKDSVYLRWWKKGVCFP